MFSGNAEGEMLPPFVVYKSTHLWTTWTENGPNGCRYSNSPSGWFDSNTFSEWFTNMMLPRLKKQEGKKVVICDNLSSHLTTNVLQLCCENNISFICLPANSTHITQPLDVSFFRPMKVAWRQILTEWKGSKQGFKETVLQKQQFPFLLRRLIDVLRPNSAENLRAGFRKCGIHPIDVEELLCRLPSRTYDGGAVQDSFIEALQNKRAEWTAGAASNRGRRKLQVTPGKSVAGKEPKVLKKKRRTHKTHNSSSEEDTETFSLKDSSDDENFDQYRKSQSMLSSEEEEEEDTLPGPKVSGPEFGEVVRTVGQHVVFKYEGEYFPGKITGISNEGATISAMQKSLKSWKWPTPKDEMVYDFDDIVGSIQPPKMISRRGFFSVPELDRFWN